MSKTLHQYFLDNPYKQIRKWNHYFSIYEKYFQNNKSNLFVEVYQADNKQIFTESIKMNGRNICSNIQTVIDLVCYGPSGKEAAIDIYSKMRGN